MNRSWRSHCSSCLSIFFSIINTNVLIDTKFHCNLTICTIHHVLRDGKDITIKMHAWLVDLKKKNTTHSSHNQHSAWKMQRREQKKKSNSNLPFNQKYLFTIFSSLPLKRKFNLVEKSVKPYLYTKFNASVGHIALKREIERDSFSSQNTFTTWLNLSQFEFW